MPQHMHASSPTIIQTSFGSMIHPKTFSYIACYEKHFQFNLLNWHILLEYDVFFICMCSIKNVHENTC